MREFLEKRPWIGLTLSLLMVLAAGYAVINFLGGSSAVEPEVGFYFTTDDGKTKISMPRQSVPPVMVDGKEAVSIFLFTEDGGLTSRIGFLQKYTPEAKSVIESGLAKGMAISEASMSIRDHQILVKKPGETEWVSKTDAKKKGFFATITGDPVLPDM
jgi:hypothetical protein